MVEQVGDLRFVAKIEAFGNGEVLTCRSGKGDSARAGKDADRAVTKAADVVCRCREGSGVEITVAVVAGEIAGDAGAVRPLRCGDTAGKDAGSRRIGAGEARREEVTGVIEEDSGNAPAAGYKVYAAIDVTTEVLAATVGKFVLEGADETVAAT